ncbi:hypothetical protein ACOMHN_026824 [Nucella lapillus]
MFVDETSGSETTVGETSDVDKCGRNVVTGVAKGADRLYVSTPRSYRTQPCRCAPCRTQAQRVSFSCLIRCSQISPNALCGLTRLPNLLELELTNCPSATPSVVHYLRENMYGCLVIH